MVPGEGLKQDGGLPDQGRVRRDPPNDAKGACSADSVSEAPKTDDCRSVGAEQAWRIRVGSRRLVPSAISE